MFLKTIGSSVRPVAPFEKRSIREMELGRVFKREPIGHNSLVRSIVELNLLLSVRY